MRRVQPLIDGLNQLGAFASSSRNDGFAPLIVKGKIKGGKATIDGRDSQPVSALLFLGAFVPLTLHVENPQETPWIELTLSWLDRFQIPYEKEGFHFYKMPGEREIPPFQISIGADFSSLAFPLAAALITQSEIELENLDFDDPQGDKKILDVLEKMGAPLKRGPTHLHVEKGAHLKGGSFDLSALIDAVPVAAAIGCFAKEPVHLTNIAGARSKESDRLRCISEELRKMGAEIDEFPDQLQIHPRRLHGAKHLKSHHDHRIAMALAVAALGADSPSTIDDVECVEKTYPGFFAMLKTLGADVLIQ